MRKTFLITVLCLFLLSFSGVALADIPAKFDVWPYKTWIIEFSGEVDISTVNQCNIYVSKDKYGCGCEVETTVLPHPSEPCCVLVQPPSMGWGWGETLYLIVTHRVHSVSGEPCSPGVLMPFTTTESTPPDFD